MLEESIISWSKERPAWQREIMRRLAIGQVLSDEEYDHLVEDIVAAKPFLEPDFGLEQLPRATPDASSVRIMSIEKPEHVNAIESKDPLTFETGGLTIVYGDNGSGKSGFARVLKRIMRARHKEDVLSDVFRDTALESPTALLKVLFGEEAESFTWPESARPELQRMLFYDAACGNAYVETESDFPYRPSALFVMDGLIDACVQVRNRIDSKLIENNSRVIELPLVPHEVRDTAVGRFLTGLTGTASVEVLDDLIKAFDESTEVLEDMKAQEASLRSSDTSKEQLHLIRLSEKLESLRRHLEQMNEVVGDEALDSLQEQRRSLKSLEDAGAVLASVFQSEALPGVGSSTWQTLWESARLFSQKHAYPQRTFPVVDGDCRCVLCQQILQEDDRERLSHFERFVKDDTQLRLAETRSLYDRKVERVSNLTASPEAIIDSLKDLETSHPDVATEVRDVHKKYESARAQLLEAITSKSEIPRVAVNAGTTVARLTNARNAAKTRAEELTNPGLIQKRLAELSRRRSKLELLEEVKKSRRLIADEIARLREREVLEAAKAAAATGPITRKILELSEETITEVVRDTFTRETDRLRLERVTIARTRADKGTLLHQPKLVGARQRVTLPRVFSEGERTALGLAAFFTEAHLDASNSAIALDDPVTSLDHIRRWLVAARLAAFAETRQVIVFTHDVSFVADLKREANGKGVPIAERSVTRSRAAERKPGACNTELPWKAKDVPARLDELRKQLARIKKESGTWDENSYEDAVAIFAGNLSETWERIFSQEIVGSILSEGGLEVRPMMVKVLACFTDDDHKEFDSSYSRISLWLRRHDKSTLVNFVAPEVNDLENEIRTINSWFKRVKGYKA